MTYRVVLSSETLAGAAKYIDYLLEKHASDAAERWWRRALASIDSLSTMPHIGPLAPEDPHREYTVRALIVRPCLFLYTIDEESKVVRVIGFRHGSQLPRPDDLPDGL